MERFLSDARYAFRQFRNSPGFPIVALLTLALGIGANTALYSIIHDALRIPYPHANRMVVVKTIYPQRSYFAVSWPDFLDWRNRSGSFQDLAGLFTSMATWKGTGSERESLNIGMVTEGYFRMYGMRPLLGRGFLPSDHERNSAPVCALGEDFWRGELKSDASVVGKPIRLDDNTCTVVAVMPRVVPDSNHPAQIWIPMEPKPISQEHGSDFLRLVGLLRPGVSETQALSELRAMQAQTNKQFPESAHGIELQSLSENVFGNLRVVFNILLAAVGFILLIACVNLANMMLANATRRGREFAIRRALGASATRILQQTLTETLLLSVCGACLGLGFATILLHVPIQAWPKGFLPLTSVRLDGDVLSFTMLLALFTGVFFGIFPGLRMLRMDANFPLQQGRAVTDSREQNRTRSILIIAQVALSMLLIAGCLNMAFYYRRLLHTDLGVNPQNVLSVGVPLPPLVSGDLEAHWRSYELLRERALALPGVLNVSAALVPPFWGASPTGRFRYDGQPNESRSLDPSADHNYVAPGYFATVQAPILKGRDFSSQDRRASPKVAIINRGLAEKLWPGQNAIGKRIHCCSQDADFTIVGIAGDVHLNGPAVPAEDEIYLSMGQIIPSTLTLLIRTSGNPFALTSSIRQAIRSINPDQPIIHLTSLETLADQTTAGQRSSTMVIAILGALALLLASIGVYGVTSYTVSHREREFGIRIALGSSRSRVVKLLISGVFPLVALGIVAGSGLAIALHAWITTLLGAMSRNGFDLLASAVLLSVVAALATLIPARRVSRIDPVVALRSE